MGVADKIIRDTLGLTPEDMAAIKEGIQTLKTEAPDLIKRLEVNEMRVYCICTFLKAQNPDLWKTSWEKTVEHYKAVNAAKTKAQQKAQPISEV